MNPHTGRDFVQFGKTESVLNKGAEKIAPLFNPPPVLSLIIMKRYDLTEAKAKDMIIKKDKQRQSYYNYYSSKKWGRADSYDLCINSSVLGVDGTVKLITQFVEDFESKN